MKTITRFIAVLGVAFFGGGGAANAMPIALTGPCPEVAAETCFVGVSGLDVGGIFYDVSFVEGLYDTVFGSNPGVALFDGDFTLASSIANILTTEFRAVGFFGTQSASGPNGGWAGADIAFNGEDGSILVWTQVDSSPATLSRPNISANWMVFTESAPVPEPATLLLFSLGLAGLGWSRRKKA